MFVSSPDAKAEQAVGHLAARYGNAEPDEADVIVALGGDGVMLQTLHRFLNCGVPIYGMHCGSVGFLMNDYHDDGLIERLKQAEINVIHPLRMKVRTMDNAIHEALAINEVSLFRRTYQAAKLRISVDNKVRLEELICDGALVATPAGSTAYNLSAYGPILPLKAPLLALTPISPFRPRHWRGAVLNNEAKVKIEVLEGQKRPVNAVADHTEIPLAAEIDVEEDASIDLLMMFDSGHTLDERILSEQFRF